MKDGYTKPVWSFYRDGSFGPITEYEARRVFAGWRILSDDRGMATALLDQMWDEIDRLRTMLGVGPKPIVRNLPGFGMIAVQFRRPVGMGLIMLRPAERFVGLETQLLIRRAKRRQFEPGRYRRHTLPKLDFGETLRHLRKLMDMPSMPSPEQTERFADEVATLCYDHGYDHRESMLEWLRKRLADGGTNPKHRARNG